MKLIWKETIQGLKQNLSLSFSSFILIQFITLLLAMSFIVFNLTNRTIYSFENETQIHAQLKDSVNGAEIEELQKEMEKKYNVSIEYSSKEKEFKKLQSFYGDEDFFEIYKNDNPLKNAFLITTDKPEDIKQIAKSIKQDKNIHNVQYGGNSLINTIQKLNMVQLSIGIVYLILTILISVILYNVTKLTVLARAESIKIKESLGAHPRVIITPFILESIIFYLISIIAPFAISIGIYWLLIDSQLLNFIMHEPIWIIGSKLLAFLVIYALFFGFINSYISVKRILTKLKKAS